MENHRQNTNCYFQTFRASLTTANYHPLVYSPSCSNAGVSKVSFNMRHQRWNSCQVTRLRQCLLDRPLRGEKGGEKCERETFFWHLILPRFFFWGGGWYDDYFKHVGKNYIYIYWPIWYYIQPRTSWFRITCGQPFYPGILQEQFCFSWGSAFKVVNRLTTNLNWVVATSCLHTM